MNSPIIKKSSLPWWEGIEVREGLLVVTLSSTLFRPGRGDFLVLNFVNNPGQISGIHEGCGG
jgi:hypothetical protein